MWLWEIVYKYSKVSNLPWFTSVLDHDVDDFLVTSGILSGKFLDLGTGPGTQAIELAKRGFNVYGTDISKTAIRKGIILSKEMKLRVKFIKDDILRTQLSCKFDYILDRGCFHTLKTKHHQKYIKNVKKLMKTDGMLFLKCFSSEQNILGPRKYSERMLREIFKDDFKILEIRNSEFRGDFGIKKAIFCIFKMRDL